MSGHKYNTNSSPMKRENSYSQLNVFKESKKEISTIFSDISDYVKDSNLFIQDIYSSDVMFQNLINVDNMKMLNNYVEKVKGIQSVINRDNMKCAFFGRTSNGKSTTINAMLGCKILPAGIGHTTSCFLEIQGTKGNVGCMSISSLQDATKTDKQEEQFIPIESVKNLARDVCASKLSTDSLIKVYWPSEKCPLLSEDVVILDSPGIDVDPDIDKWIDNHCLDADVFVLVANSEATLNTTEKAFFHKVRDRLSKPNVFILNNRWDASADQIEFVKEAREQHMERCVNFLTKELKVCSKAEAESRVFFVSASEALHMRSKTEDSGSVTESPGFIRLREGWQSRLFEFTNFEKNLEKTLSESATKTKFAAHSTQGQEIVNDVKQVVENLNEKAQEQKDAAVKLTHKMSARSEKLDSARKAAYKDSAIEIARLAEKVAEKVADVLRDQLRRLGDVIDEFDHSFYEEPGLLAKYKIELSQHVERQLGNNLTSICARDMCQQVDTVGRAIVDRFSALVPDVADQMRQSLCDEYTPKFYIDCNNIAADFHEDLAFRFSWGPWAILSRMVGASMVPLGSGVSIGNSSGSNLLSLMALRQYLPNVTGRAVLASVICGGLVVKATGWRVVGVCAAIYGAMYAYEYSTWTTRAKEKAFKAQFRTYVAQKLEYVMSMTSKHSAEQPQNALNATVRSLNGFVDAFQTKLKTDIAKFESDTKRLEEIVSESRKLKNKALFLEKVLKDFHDRFIMV